MWVRGEPDAHRDRDAAHVERDAIDVALIEIDAGLVVVGEAVGVRQLGRPHRRGQAHVALERVGGEVVERRLARLEAEPADVGSPVLEVKTPNVESGFGTE